MGERPKATYEPSLGGFSEVSLSPRSDDSGEWHDEAFADRYQKDYLLGEGGMGSVYSAFDRHLERQVALKQLASHLSPDTANSAEQRLTREAKIMAGLQHPGIVAIHDCGIDSTGNRHYIMQLFRGQSLRVFLGSGSKSRTLGTLLRHFLNTCQAMAYAHEHGIVHGDLKPENIMVANQGDTQVVDWGLARRITEAHTEGITGTLGYMSPEQALGDGASRQSDVFSLGKILGEITSATQSEPESRSAELNAVVEKCLKEDSSLRYQDAAELAQEIRQYLDGQRVAAHSYTSWELVRRVVIAWRIPLLIVAAAILLFLIATGVFIQRIRSENRRAISAEASAIAALVSRDQAHGQGLAEQARYHFQNGNHAEAELLAVSALRHRESPTARGILATLHTQPKRFEVSAGPILNECEILLPTSGDYALCGGTGHSRVVDSRSGSTIFSLDENYTAIQSVGQYIVLIDLHDQLQIYSKAGVPLGRFHMHSLREVHSISNTEVLLRNFNVFVHVNVGSAKMSPEFRPCTDAIVALDVGGGMVASVCPDSTIVVQKVDNPLDSRRLDVAMQPTQIAINATATRLAVGAVDGSIAIFGVTENEIEPTASRFLTFGQHTTLTWIENTPWLVVVPEVGAISVWDTKAGHKLLQLPLDAGRIVSVSGNTLVTAGSHIQRWNLAAMLPPLRWDAGSGLSSAAVSPDGKWLAAATGSGRIVVWDRISGTSNTIEVSDQVIKRVSFSSDGSSMVAAVAGSTGIYRIDRTTKRVTALPAFSAMRRVLVTEDGSAVGIDYADGLFLWTEDSNIVRISSKHHYIDMDGHTAVVLLDKHGNISRLVGQERTHVTQIPSAVAVAIDDEGNTIVVSTAKQAYLLRDGKTTLLEGHEGPFLDIAIGETTIAAGTRDGMVVLWDRQSLNVQATLRGHSQRVAFVDYVAGGLLISAGWDGIVRWWDPKVLSDEVAALSEKAQLRWRDSVTNE